jgi:hypothetical protein
MTKKIYSLESLSDTFAQFQTEEEKENFQSVFLNHRVCKVNFNLKKEKMAYLPMQRQRRNWTIGETESRS